MQDDEPVPYNIERKEKVKDVRRVKHSWLKRRQKGDARIIVGVPEREYEVLYLGDPENFRRDEKGCKVSFAKDAPGRKHRMEIDNAEKQKEQEGEETLGSVQIMRARNIFIGNLLSLPGRATPTVTRRNA